MTSKLRTLMIGGALGTTALIGLGGGAVAWAQAEGTTPPPDAPADAPAEGTTPLPDAPTDAPSEGHRKPSERRAEIDEALAAKLGRTTDELKAAREAAHDAVVAELGEMTRPDSRPDTDEEREALKAQLQARHDLFDTKLAEALGISVDDLKAARLAVAEERLAEKVAAGELTQEQADARLEAIRNGEVPDGFGRGPGGHGRGHGGERGAEAQEALAAKLGTTTDALKAARQRAHDAVVAELGELTRPETPPSTDEEREAMKAQFQQRRDLENQKFAEALGISVEDLKAARIAVVQDELNAKVAAGEMTQEEADAKIAALQSGELPDGFGHRGHGGPGRHGRFGGGN
jgi:hypothetical protein